MKLFYLQTEILRLRYRLQCYSMKLYSNRKAKKIKEVLEEDDRSESRKTSDKTE